MLNYFTTWNCALCALRPWRRDQSRALLVTSVIVSATGVAMLAHSVLAREPLQWKERRITWAQYAACELAFHQLPLLIALRQTPRGNANAALMPVVLYCSFVANPYRIAGRKIRNWHGVALTLFTAGLCRVLGESPTRSGRRG